MLDLSKISNVEFDGVDLKDYPDFSDAYVESALYDGREMTDEELDELNNVYSDFVYEELMDYIF